MRRFVTAALLGLCALGGSAARVDAASVAVRFVEGTVRAFPVLRSVQGETLAHGELVQMVRGDRVESRLSFRFLDGSLYDERVVFSQADVFTLLRYAIVQRGPSFPETIEASVDRETARYDVRYKEDHDSPEQILTGRVELPPDVYNGMLGLAVKNLPADASETVQIVAFTPKPRIVKILLAPAGADPVVVGDRPMTATRYVMKPQLGLLVSLLVSDIPPAHYWILTGEAPAFVRFQGPLYFMGPIWRIE